MSAAHKAFYRVIEALLEDRPDEWTSDSFNLWNHSAGVSIWIANAAYGLSLDVGGARLNPSWWWRRRLRRAADKHLIAKSIARIKGVVAKVGA